MRRVCPLHGDGYVVPDSAARASSGTVRSLLSSRVPLKGLVPWTVGQCIGRDKKIRLIPRARPGDLVCLAGAVQGQGCLKQHTNRQTNSNLALAREPPSFQGAFGGH